MYKAEDKVVVELMAIGRVKAVIVSGPHQNATTSSNEYKVRSVNPVESGENEGKHQVITVNESDIIGYDT